MRGIQNLEVQGILFFNEYDPFMYGSLLPNHEVILTPNAGIITISFWPLE